MSESSRTMELFLVGVVAGCLMRIANLLGHIAASLHALAGTW